MGLWNKTVGRLLRWIEKRINAELDRRHRAPRRSKPPRL